MKKIESASLFHRMTTLPIISASRMNVVSSKFRHVKFTEAAEDEAINNWCSDSILSLAVCLLESRNSLVSLY